MIRIVEMTEDAETQTETEEEIAEILIDLEITEIEMIEEIVNEEAEAEVHLVVVIIRFQSVKLSDHLTLRLYRAQPLAQQELQQKKEHKQKRLLNKHVKKEWNL